MKTINKNLFNFLVLLFLVNFLNPKILANENLNFLSLKNNEVNVRLGPSKKYPIKYIYKKKYLPLEILDKSETWRKIKDFEKNSGWIHISQLSKKKTAINIKDSSILYKKPTVYSEPIAKLQVGRLVLIKKCKNTWCKVNSGNYSGWISENYLWGKIK
tara:strand:- start:333 stop:806 length:474 start_codon:yes stop_codon:yes gene_type:complete